MSLSNLLINTPLLNTLYKLEDGHSMLAIAGRDAVDNAGRITQAYRRDADDGRERLIEENATTLIWGFGIGFIKKCIVNPIARKLTTVKAPEVNLTLLNEGPQQLTPQKVRRFAPENQHLMQLATSDSLKKTYKRFGVTKFLLATMIPITLISFGIPTLNQWLTKKEQRKKYFKKQEHLYQNIEQPIQSSDLFTPFKQSQFSSNPVKFSGTTALLSKFIENDRLNTLLVDGTISGGRTYKARNIFERLEVIFQEASIVFFLYYAADYIQSKLNIMVDKKTGAITDLPLKILNSLRQGNHAQQLSLLNHKELMQLQELTERKLLEKIYHYMEFNLKHNVVFELAKENQLIPTKNASLDITQTIDTGKIKHLSEKLAKFKQVTQADSSVLKKLAAKSLKARVGTFLVANTVCSIALGWVIPKLKQQITVALTGKDEFPGTMK